MTDKSECYTVWVGGAEVNDHLLTKKLAKAIARIWRDEGYDDVQIEKVA
jgi:hypothetical protein